MRAHEVRSLRIWGLIIGGIGALAVMASIGLGLPLLVYLISLAILARGLVHLCNSVQEDRHRRYARIGTALLVVAAIVGPWGFLALERRGNPLWEVSTASPVDLIYSDGSRVLFTDRDGLHAVDLRSGDVLWSYERIEVATADPWVLTAATDGHVLAQYFIRPGEMISAWISPEGEVLWSTTTPEDSGADLTADGQAFRFPIASSGGHLVVAPCDDDAETKSCRYVGIGPDGTEEWSRDGMSRGELRATRTVYRGRDSSSLDPREIPEVAVVQASGTPTPGVLTPAALVDPVDGSTTASIEVGASIAVLGDTVVYETGPAAEPGLCRTRGLSTDGDVSWERDAPCLTSDAIAPGEWIYGTLEGVPGSDVATTGGELHDSFAMDPSTGTWRRVGPLVNFNDRGSLETGEPGADIVVQRHGHRLSAIDPGSGEEGWTLDVPNTASVPSVDVGQGAAAVYYAPEAILNPFTSGKARKHGTRALVVDTRTGRVTGSYSSPTWIDAAPVAPGQMLIVREDDIALIGSRST